MAVRWVLDKDANIALWGARRPNQLDPVKKVLGWKLNKEDFIQIEKILSNSIKEPIGPQFMAPPAR